MSDLISRQKLIDLFLAERDGNSGRLCGAHAIRTVRTEEGEMDMGWRITERVPIQVFGVRRN